MITDLISHYNHLIYEGQDPVKDPPELQAYMDKWDGETFIKLLALNKTKNTPEESARQAVENDVHILGVSSLAAGHKTLIPQVIEELKKLGREDIVVIAGGVIPAQDYDFLYKAGVAAIYGPGTPITKSAINMIEILNSINGYDAE